MFQESGLHCWSQSKLSATEKHAVCLTDRGAQSCVHLSLVPGLAGVGARPPVGGWGKPPWGVAPDRQKKVPWTTLTSLSASRQVSTVLAVFSVYTQERYPFPFVFLHKGFLSLVLSSFYTKDFYFLSFHLFTQRIFILLLSSLYTQDFYPCFFYLFLHKGFLSLVLSFYTNNFIFGPFIFFTIFFYPVSFHLFYTKDFYPWSFGRLCFIFVSFRLVCY